MSFKLLKLISYFLLFFSVQVQSEIYQWVDSQGHIQFSDSPHEEYAAAGYSRQLPKAQSLTTSVPASGNPKDLESIAKELKKDRLKRQRLRDKDSKARAKTNKKRQQQLVAAKKRKLACKKARDKEDLAFRQRTQRQGLMKMRKALANYEKKRETRRKNCSS